MSCKILPRRFLAMLIVCSLLFVTSKVHAGDKTVRQKKEDLENSSLSQKDNRLKQLNDSIDEELAKLVKIQQLKNMTAADSLKSKVIVARLQNLQETKKDLENQSLVTGTSDVQQDFLSISILVFGLLLSILIVIFQWRNKGLSYLTFKLLGVIFIGTVSIFLIPAGFDNAQITPVVGLLGTLAGYLIGSSGTQQNQSSPSPAV